jgi:dGTPase
MGDNGYTAFDLERAFPEGSKGERSDFARDRGRLLHSSALRRLAAKTQVLSPTAGLDFARNRLTHSLEVAQVGREIGASLGLDPDLVDTACLAHDLGHPPFGHNGEKALNDWALPFGGFEGNAQTLRILTRIEPKVFDDAGRSFGLNLTRASLDASCKYPWTQETGVAEPGGRTKFGVYESDIPIFDWVRAGAQDRRLCIEAQVMDLSDDIGYSVHDFEDAIVSGYIDVRALSSRVDHDDLVDSMVEWIGGELPHDELLAAFDRLDGLASWIETWEGSPREMGALKNLTSTLIGRFAGSATAATREHASATSLVRFGADVVVPAETRAEIAVLKGIVAANVMSHESRRPIYSRQRELIHGIVCGSRRVGNGPPRTRLCRRLP